MIINLFSPDFLRTESPKLQSVLEKPEKPEKLKNMIIITFTTLSAPSVPRVGRIDNNMVWTGDSNIETRTEPTNIFFRPQGFREKQRQYKTLKKLPDSQ